MSLFRLDRCRKDFCLPIVKPCFTTSTWGQGCGGANEFTRCAREAFDAAERALDECLKRHGRKASDSRTRAIADNPNDGRNVRYSMPESSGSNELQF